MLLINMVTASRSPPSAKKKKPYIKKGPSHASKIGIFMKREEYQSIFERSKKITNPNKPLTEFYGNASMAKLLDVFFDNPDTLIYTIDLLRVSGLSRRVMYFQTPLLIKHGIIVEIETGPCKFYKLNDSLVVKQISNFRDILIDGSNKNGGGGKKKKD